MNDIKRLRMIHDKIIFTNGCFDIIHVGHLKLLNEAKLLGNILIVGLNSDKSIRKIKGPKRPINNFRNRAEILLNFRSVDFVIGFDDETPLSIIDIIKPDIHVKGGDYSLDDLNEFPEAELVIKYGGEVHIVQLYDDNSTTNTINKIINNKTK